jgi:hypothetical protein
MLIVWSLLAVLLVVIVAGGFVGRSRRARTAEQTSRNAGHKATHHGKGARKSRGRGRGH